MNNAIKSEKVFTLIALFIRKEKGKPESRFLIELLYCYNVFFQDFPRDS